MPYTFRPNGDEALLLCTGKELEIQTTVWIDRFDHDAACYRIRSFGDTQDTHLYITRNERREMVERDLCIKLVGRQGYRGLLDLSETLFAATRDGTPSTARFNYFNWELRIPCISGRAISFMTPSWRHAISREGVLDFFEGRAVQLSTKQESFLYHPAALFLTAYGKGSSGGHKMAA